jgi:hypothetical protein
MFRKAAEALRQRVRRWLGITIVEDDVERMLTKTIPRICDEVDEHGKWIGATDKKLDPVRTCSECGGIYMVDHREVKIVEVQRADGTIRTITVCKWCFGGLRARYKMVKRS